MYLREDGWYETSRWDLWWDSGENGEGVRVCGERLGESGWDLSDSGRSLSSV